MKKILLIILFLLLVDLIAVFLFFQQITNFLIDNTCIRKHDAGVVFFGDYDDENQAIGKIQLKRLDLANRSMTKKSSKI